MDNNILLRIGVSIISVQLIVNADDFGLSKGVNHGIMEAHHEGIVSSATIMVNMPGFEDAVESAKKTPSLGVGFHFNLSYGMPLSPPHEVPSLVDEHGNFHKMKMSNPRKWREEDVKKELHRQWTRVKETGISITHLDSHHYIQRISTVYPAYSQLAHEEGLPMRHTFQFPENYNYDDYEPISSTKNALPLDHPATTDAFVGDIYFRDQRFEQLRQHIHTLPPGITEINCHPGYVDDELEELSVWTSYREIELATLTHTDITKFLKQEKIELVNFHILHK